MINKVSGVPFKINVKVLENLITDKHKLLIDSHIVADQEKEINNMTKYQLAKFKSLKSKFNLQETILGIADFYKSYNNIYFPLRLDSRGRIYCNTNYLNYQSSELAKSLLLFSNPSLISKKNLSNVKYLEYYGVNCFGKDKISDKLKVK
jgi:DNA-directed RNA polymerase